MKTPAQYRHAYLLLLLNGKLPPLPRGWVYLTSSPGVERVAPAVQIRVSFDKSIRVVGADPIPFAVMNRVYELSQFVQQYEGFSPDLLDEPDRIGDWLFELRTAYRSIDTQVFVRHQAGPRIPIGEYRRVSPVRWIADWVNAPEQLTFETEEEALSFIKTEYLLFMIREDGMGVLA